MSNRIKGAGQNPERSTDTSDSIRYTSGKQVAQGYFGFSVCTTYARLRLREYNCSQAAYIRPFLQARRFGQPVRLAGATQTCHGANEPTFGRNSSLFSSSVKCINPEAL